LFIADPEQLETPTLLVQGTDAFVDVRPDDQSLEGSASWLVNVGGHSWMCVRRGGKSIYEHVDPKTLAPTGTFADIGQHEAGGHAHVYGDNVWFVDSGENGHGGLYGFHASTGKALAAARIDGASFTGYFGVDTLWVESRAQLDDCDAGVRLDKRLTQVNPATGAAVLTSTIKSGAFASGDGLVVGGKLYSVQVRVNPEGSCSPAYHHVQVIDTTKLANGAVAQSAIVDGDDGDMVRLLSE
jgi:hypothetical protein